MNWVVLELLLQLLKIQLHHNFGIRGISVDRMRDTDTDTDTRARYLRENQGGHPEVCVRGQHVTVGVCIQLKPSERVGQSQVGGEALLRPHSVE